MARDTQRLAAWLLLATLWPAAAVADRPGPDREQLETQLRELRMEIDIIRERLNEALGQRDQALDALAAAEREVSQAARARRQTTEQMAHIDSRITQLATEQEELEDQAAVSTQALARQLVLAYTQGGQSRLKVLLNQDNPRQVSRHLAYHGYLSRARLQAMEALNVTLNSLRATRDELEERYTELERLARQQESELERLEVAREQREIALKAVESRIQTRQQELAELERDAAELADLLDELASALADIPPEFEVPSIADLRGQLPLPVHGRLRQRFGDARGGELTWNGWLFDAAVGTEVSAIAHGRVAYSDWLRGYGLILILDHGDAFMSLYAHNEALLRDVGDWVGPGDVIATVGNTGSGGEPGLYFELRRNGQPLNPAGWLNR